MQKNTFKKGIMLITVLIISSLLLIFFLASISAISGQNKNASTSLEREQAMAAIKIGMNNLLESIDDELEKNKTDFNLPSVEILKGWTDVTNNTKLSYQYTYKDGVAVVGGRYQINSPKDTPKYITRVVRVSYAVEAMGVTAESIKGKEGDDKGKGPSISSVYSNETQIPFNAWIYSPDIDVNNVYFQGSSNASKKIIANENFKNSAVLGNCKTMCNIAKALRLNDSEWDGNRYMSYASFNSRYQSTADEGRKQLRKNPLISKRKALSILPESLGGYLSTYNGEISGNGDYGVGVSLTESKFHQAVPTLDDYPDGIRNKNVWFIPYNDTIYWDGDLLLKENALLFVSGNLVVKGNILGSGYLYVMNNLYFLPKNVDDEGNVVPEEFKNGNLLVYAGRNIRVINPDYFDFSTYSISSQALAAIPRELPSRIAETTNNSNTIDSSQLPTELKALILSYIKEASQTDPIRIWAEEYKIVQ